MSEINQHVAVSKSDPSAKIPVYSTSGAAGADLYALKDTEIFSIPNTILVTVCVLMIHALQSSHILHFWLCLPGYLIATQAGYESRRIPVLVSLALGIVAGIVLEQPLHVALFSPILAWESAVIFRNRNSLITSVVDTGVSLSIAQGFYGCIRDRSSMAARDISVVAGVIDSDYNGQIKVLLRNFGLTNYCIRKGNKIAQIIISPVVQANAFIPVACEDRKEGDARGLGSTGK